MPKFRKKPVIVDAVRVDNANLDELFRLMDSDPEHVRVLMQTHDGRITNWLACVEIETLEGTMRGDIGDWIITGVHGEHYPCKPDIFAATYDPAEEEV
jgi:hypothetical protein